ncbi:MAG TPA: primosomal protein N' [Bacilli bacterium]|nr:primosomal protein N' [Bacilli bacterium]
MYILEVLIEHPRLSLNRPFTYSYKGKELLSVGTRVFINFNNQKIVGYVTKVEETTKSIKELEEEKGFVIKEIDRVIDDNPILTPELVLLADQVASYYFTSKIAVLQAMLPPSLRPKKSFASKPKIKTRTLVVALTNDTNGLTKRQAEVLKDLYYNGASLKSDYSASIIDKLSELGKVSFKEREVYRYNIEESDLVERYELTEDQRKVIDQFNETNYETYLLEGVTGSGKTEVYVELAKQCIARGKQVLLLVPEIALTDGMVNYFKSRFTTNVAVLHSGLTDAQKYDEYRRIKNEQVDIVIGARSAIFAPLSKIGLFIIDEEHSETYKQDITPYYDARTVAIMRAKLFNAKVLLGSATPSLETRARAQKKVYGYLKLTKRINKKPLPKTTIVNLSDVKFIGEKSPFISKPLEAAINDSLNRKEQVILLVNRRGYAPYIACRNCDYVFRCPTCDTTLTLHSKDNELKCHHCGYRTNFVRQCPRCLSKKINYSGFGTQKIFEDIQKMYPEASILRLDSDEANKREQAGKIVNLFANGVADILIGTQMIAKGHDFPNVTLSGVVNPDISLAIPSFRSAERTFQLITQVVGRSGRAKKEGIAIIQTANPNHYAISYGAKQNYEAFFKKEMELRRQNALPPYYHLIVIELGGKDEASLEETLGTMKALLLKELKNEIIVLGPSESDYHPRSRLPYKRLIIKHRNYFKIKPILFKVLQPIISRNIFDVLINVDPLDV